MNIESYTKGNSSLEEKENTINELVNCLDEQSFDLFSEVIDLGTESYYKLSNISIRLKELSRISTEVLKSYDYLSYIEQDKCQSIYRKFQLKRMLTMIVTIYSFFANMFLAVISFIVLNNKANKDFISDYKEIEKLDLFDEEKLKRINITLDNSLRIFKNKLEKMSEHEKELFNNKNINNNCTIYSNEILYQYLINRVSYDEMMILPQIIKDKIVDILKSDLRVDIDDYSKLLTIVKENNDNSLKLIKEY